MPFHEDLSTCSDGPEPGDEPAVNVGWLARRHAFPTGTVPDGFAPRLARLVVRHPVNRTRGWQRCPFCRRSEYPARVYVEGQEVPVGDAEIWVPRAGGGAYVAPTLVVHYVAAHRYRPPAEFIEAVMADERAGEPA